MDLSSRRICSPPLPPPTPADSAWRPPGLAMTGICPPPPPPSPEEGAWPPGLTMTDEVRQHVLKKELEKLDGAEELAIADLKDGHLGLIGDKMVHLVRSVEIILRAGECKQLHMSNSDSALLKTKYQSTKCMKCITDDIIKLLHNDWKTYLNSERKIKKVARTPQTRASKVRRLMKVWALIEQETRNHVLKGRENTHINIEAIGAECMHNLLEKWSMIEKEGPDGHGRNDDVEWIEELKAVIYPNSVKERIEVWLKREERNSLQQGTRNDNMANKITQYVLGNIACNREYMKDANHSVAEPHIKTGKQCECSNAPLQPRAEENLEEKTDECLPNRQSNSEHVIDILRNQGTDKMSGSEMQHEEALREFVKGYVCGIAFAADDIVKKDTATSDNVIENTFTGELVVENKEKTEGDLEECILKESLLSIPDSDIPELNQEDSMRDFARDFVYGILVAAQTLVKSEVDSVDDLNEDENHSNVETMEKYGSEHESICDSDVDLHLIIPAVDRQESSLETFACGCIEGILKAQDIARKEETENFMKMQYPFENVSTGQADLDEVEQDTCILKKSDIEISINHGEDLTERNEEENITDESMMEGVNEVVEELVNSVIEMGDDIKPCISDTVEEKVNVIEIVERINATIKTAAEVASTDENTDSEESDCEETDSDITEDLVSRDGSCPDTNEDNALKIEEITNTLSVEEEVKVLPREKDIDDGDHGTRPGCFVGLARQFRHIFRRKKKRSS